MCLQVLGTRPPMALPLASLPIPAYVALQGALLEGVLAALTSPEGPRGMDGLGVEASLGSLLQSGEPDSKSFKQASSPYAPHIRNGASTRRDNHNISQSYFSYS